MGRPTMHFDSVTSIQPGSDEEDATGILELDGKQVEVTFSMIAEQAGSEDMVAVYRRELVKIRDALTDVIENPQGITVS